MSFADTPGRTLAKPGAITALAYSPDGKRLAVGTYGEVALYDTATWQPVATFLNVEDSARALAFSPDSQTLAIGSGIPGTSGRLTLWDVNSVKPPVNLPAQKDTVEAVAFRKDGIGLLLGSNDNHGSYYPALPSSDHTSLDEHNGRVTAVAFSSRDNFVFLTGGQDKIVKAWDEKTRKAVVNFDQSEAGITGLVALPGGAQFVGSSLDGRLYGWQVYYSEKQKAYGGNRTRTADAHPGGVLALAISADGKRLITGGEDSVVCLWDSQNLQRREVFKEPKQPIYAVALSPDGKIAVGAGREGLVYVWDVAAKKSLIMFTPPALPAPPVSAPPKSTPKSKPAPGEKKK